MTTEVEKILFDLSEEMTRALYDLNNMRKDYHKGILAKENIESYLRELEERQKAIHERVKKIMAEL